MVDDVLDNAAILRDVLEHAGASVDTVDRGEDALALAAARPSSP